MNLANVLRRLRIQLRDDETKAPSYTAPLRDYSNTLISPRISSKEHMTMAMVKDYIEGDQWGGGRYWRGRRPHSDTNEGWAEIWRLFTQDNQLKPAIRRYVNAILGKNFEWDLRRDGVRPKTGALRTAAVKDDELTTLIRQMTDWDYAVDLIEVMQKAMFDCLSLSRACIRLYVPDEYADEIKAGLSFDEALEIICVHVVQPHEGGAIRDVHGRVIGYYYAFTDYFDDGPTRTFEVHTPEFIYLYKTNSEGDFIPVREGEGPGAKPYARRNPLWRAELRRKPRFLMSEIDRGESMITPDLIDKQNGLNVTLTHMRRNDELAGFRSVATINAENPVEFNPDTGRDEPVPWKMSGDIIMSIRGIGVGYEENAEGELVPTNYATPQLQVIDPVDPEYFLKTAENWRVAIASDFDQGFIYNPYRAESGESKRENRNAFDRTVIDESQLAASAIRFAIENVIAYAGQLSNTYEAVADVSCTPKLFLDVPRGNLEVFKAMILAHGDNVNLASRQVAVESNPAVVDPEAEMELLQIQEDKIIAKQKEVEEAERQASLKDELEKQRSGVNRPTGGSA